jgi:hypothetical protein
MATNPAAPLLPGISQYDVDFVIPRIGIDIQVGIDPFLLYKSRDPVFRELHAQLIGTFNAGIAAVRQGDIDEAHRIFDFPEVAAIGFGYTRSGKRGSGVGTYMARLIVETVEGSTGLQERGVRHVEEMQLLSAGIGPDRVSDITANILKRFLIDYTQRQCQIWNLPVKDGVPLQHVYDHTNREWIDLYEAMLVSPIDGSPILLVPRRWVRVLPWINYDDFSRTEFNAYLAARRANARNASEAVSSAPVGEPRLKPDVVTVTRSDISLIERYVRSREQLADRARPALDYIDEDVCRQAEALAARLDRLQVGREQAAEYQHLVLEILNYLFSPELIDGQPEVRTVDGTERRDIVFTNDSDETFWEYVRTAHDGIVLMFEVKNTSELDTAAINQTATYLGDRIGRLGVIVTRHAPSDAIQKKIFSVWNDSAPNRKVVLTLTDDQLKGLLNMRCEGTSPTRWMQQHYRNFRTAVQ